jgi:hypothetical protein
VSEVKPVETVFCLRGELWDRALIAEARVSELQARVAELERFHDVVQTAMQIHVIDEDAIKWIDQQLAAMQGGEA